jgi:uncharacterized protein (TIGR02117 family)
MKHSKIIRSVQCFKRSLMLTCIAATILESINISDLYASNSNYADIYHVWVIQEFWHTGIVFNTEDVDPGHWPDIVNYKNRKYLDIGWGDEKFYQVSGNPVLLAARAIFWPTQSVLQVFSFNTPLRSAYGAGSRILRIPLSRSQFESLCRYVSESFVRDEAGDPITSSAYGHTDHFFLSTGKYHLFSTCNTWVAKAFRQSGLEVRSFFVLNANQLFRQLSSLPGTQFED